MISTIVLEGDSHTWGQGVDGERHFSPPAQGGEKRLMPFIYPCYANRLREKINALTDSSADEYEPKRSGVYRLFCEAGLFRIQILAAGIGGRLQSGQTEIYLDGRLCFNIELDEKKPYVIIPLFCNSGMHELIVKDILGDNIIYRIEAYAGNYAVINSGIGSTSLSAYLKSYWQEYVCVYKPKIIIGEANTINDWLSGQSPEEYRSSLFSLIERSDDLGSVLIMHTTAPIRGAQKEPWSAWEYETYIEQVKRAAQSRKIPLADTNERVKAEISMGKEVFWDDWHVNEYAHGIYAEEIINYLKDYL